MADEKAKVPARFGEILARALSPGFVNAAKDAIRLDSWINVLTGLGGAKDRTTAAQVGPICLLTVPELDRLYHGEDLPNKIVAKLPDEAFRVGFKTGNAQLDEECTYWNAAGKLCEADKWGRLYGGGAIFLGLSDRLGCQHEPVDLACVGQGDLHFLHVLDRWEMSPGTYGKDGEIETYMITPLTVGTGSGSELPPPGTRVHRSRLILFGGAHTSSRWRAMNGGFDLSVIQRVHDILRDEGQSWRSIMNLLSDLSQAVFAINGLVDMISNGQKNVLLDRMEIVNMARSVNRAVLIDKDGETFNHVGAQNITGVEPLLLALWQRVAGAVDIPMTELFGMSPAGLNATGESDRAMMYARANKHRQDITPQVRRLARCLARNAGMAPPDAIVWPSLWEPTPSEQADLEVKQAQADGQRIVNQIATPEECRAVRFGGKRWEDVYADAQNADAEIAADLSQAGEQETADEDYAIEGGQVWIDTRDQHRIQVNRTGKNLLGGALVYACDLDAPNPREQFSWSRATFLERCLPPVTNGPASA